MQILRNFFNFSIRIKNVQRTVDFGAKGCHFNRTSSIFSQLKAQNIQIFGIKINYNSRSLRLYKHFKVWPKKRIREQVSDHYQGRLLHNFHFFKVAKFNNFFYLNLYYKFMLSLSCSLNTLYEYIRVTKFPFNFMSQFFDFPNFFESEPIT